MRDWLLRFAALCVLSVPLLLTAQEGLPLYDLPAPFEYPVATSGSMAISRGGRLLVSNPLTEQVSIVNPNTGELEAEFTVGGEPGGVFITEDNRLGLALSGEAGTLVVIDLEAQELRARYEIGGQPVALVARDGFAYVSLQARQEVAVVALDGGRIVQRIPTPADPAALALWGDFLYVTHFWSGELSLVYLPAGQVVRTIRPAADASLSQAIEIDPIAGRAFLPQSLSNPAARAVDNRIIPVLHVIDLSTMQVQQQINFAVADRVVNMPFAVDQPSNRTRLYVAHAGSDAVTVLNLDTGLADAHFSVGANPRAILFNSNFSRVYTQDAVDGTVSVVDTQFFGLEDTIPAHTQRLAPERQIGAALFHSANDPRLSAMPAISCASCHYAGQPDGRTWDGAATPALASAAYDAQWLNAHIQDVQGGTGLEAGGLDLQALLGYVGE